MTITTGNVFTLLTAHAAGSVPHSVTGTLNISSSNGTMSVSGSGALMTVDGTVNVSGLMTYSSGTMTVNGIIDFNSSNSQNVPTTITVATAGEMRLSNAGNKTLSPSIDINGKLLIQGNAGTSGTAPTFSGATSTLEYKGSSAQTVSTSEWTNAVVGSPTNVIINNASGVNYSGAHTITGTLTLKAGTFAILGNTLTFQSGNVPIARNGTTEVGNMSINPGTTGGSLIFGTAGNTGGNAFTIPNNTFNAAPSFDNLTVNRTNPLGLGNQSLTLAGVMTLTLGEFQLNGNTLTINGSVAGTSSGTVTGSSASNMVIGGGGTMGTVYFTQTSSSTRSLNSLSINRGSTGTATLGNNLDITGSANALALTQGKIILGTANLTLGTTSTYSGGTASNSYVVAVGTGSMFKTFNGATSFTYPIGDAVDISPATLSFSANSLSARPVGVRVSLGIPPNNGAATAFLERYWTLSESAGGTYSYTATFNYLSYDIIGTESVLLFNRYNGSAWTQYTTILNAGANQISNASALTQVTGPLGGNVFTGRYSDPFVTATTGNWNTGSTWLGGLVPGPNDNATILNGHAVTVNSNANVNNLNVNNGGTLIVTTGGTLNAGPSCGGNRQLYVNGTLTISGGTLNVNGNVILDDQSTFNMSSGALNVDGNDGTLAGSIGENIPLMEVITGDGTVNGGTITIVDPHFSAGNNAGVAYRYSASDNDDWAGNTLIFGGTGGCVDASAAVNGFNVDTYGNGKRVYLGNVIINGLNGATSRFTTAFTSSAHEFNIGGVLTVNSNCELHTITNRAHIFAAGNIINNGAINIAGGTIFGWEKEDGTSSTVAQTISGSGTFSWVPNSFLDIDNVNASGITLSVNLTVNGTLRLYNGITKLGSHNFTMGNSTTSNIAGSTPNNTNMIVTDGTGEFRWTFPPGSVGQLLFPIGDITGTNDYSPVMLSINTNSVTRIVGVRVVDAVHPNQNTPIPGGPDFLSRYWLFSDNGTTNSYTYSGYLQHVVADVNGSQSALDMQNWNGSAWSSIPNNNVGLNPPRLIFGNSTPFLLNGAQLTGRTLNDDCPGVLLTQSASCNPTGGSTIGVTSSINEHNGDDDAVWFNFTAGSANSTIQVTGSGGFDGVLELRDFSNCPANDIRYHDFTGANGVEVMRVSGLTIGQNYKLRVFSHGTASADQGNFNICLYNYTPGTNDNVLNATTAAIGSTTGNSNTLYGFQIGEQGGSNWISPLPVNTQWFTFTPAASGCYSVASTGFNTQLAIYTATNINSFSTFSEIASDDDSGPSGGYPASTSFIASVTLTAGTTYYMQVNGSAMTTGIPTLIIDAVAAPVFSTCPGSVSINTASGLCNAVGTYTTSVSGTAPVITYAFTGATTASGSGDGSGSTFNTGTTNVSITATNACGTVNCNFPVTVTDNENPVPTVSTLPDVTGECAASTSIIPTANDNCAGTVTATTSDPTSYSTQGSFVIHWSYDDGNGNVVTQNQNVIIDDITNPTINGCPADITSCNPVVSWTVPTASDNCGFSSLSSSHNPGDTFPLGNTTVTYTADDGNGNTATCSFTVTVKENPTVVISNNSSICLGQSATVHLVFTGTGPWNYTISDGTQNVSGSTSANPANIIITPSSAGVHNYTVTVLSDVNCPGPGSGTAIIAVSSSVPANSIGNVNGPTEACNGTVVLMTTNIVNGQNITYSWNTGTNSSVVKFSTNAGGPFGPGPFSTTAPEVYAQFGALSGSSGYNVCVQAVNGCGSSNNKCTWIRGVVGVPGNISGPIVACPNDVKSYSCGLSGGATVYTWTLAGSSTPVTNGQGTPNAEVTFPAGFVSGQLCVTAALSCGGSSTSAPRCVTISNAPALPGTITGPSKVCPGATGVVFSITSVAGATGYNWTSPVGTTITSGQNTPSIIVNFPTPYTGAPPVCVSALSSCASSTARCKTVGTNLPGQPGSVTGPTTGVCNSTVQYSISNVASATSYTWSIPAGSTNFLGQGSTSIQFTVPPSPFTSGQVTVVANTTACTPGTSIPRTITIYGAPGQPGTISAFPSAWCDGGFVNFSITPASPLPVYQWIVTNGTIDAGQNSNNIDVTWGTGAGTVKVRATNSCGASNYRTLNTSSVCRESFDFTQELLLSVYPNPAHDKLTVEMNNGIDEKAEISITDLTGKLIFTEQMQFSKGMAAFEIDLTHIAKGTYVFLVKKTSGIVRQKITIQ